VENDRAVLMAEHDAIDLKLFNDAVKGVEKEMNAIEMRIAQVAFEKKRADDIIARNLLETDELNREIAELQALIAGESPALESLKREKAEVERSVGAMSSELETLEAEWNARTTQVNELTIALVKLRGDLQNAIGDAKRIGHSLEEALRDIVLHEEQTCGCSTGEERGGRKRLR